MDQGKLWAGTSSGLLEVDPVTGQYVQALPYETTGTVFMLLALEEGRIWVEADGGHFYFDGQHWSEVQISGPRYGLRPTGAMIDQNGDLVLQNFTGNSRTQSQYRLPGHIPPSNQPWTATWEPFPWSSDDCSWQSFTNGRSFYRSPAECKTQNQIIKSFSPSHNYDALNVATDKDGSVWWISSKSTNFVDTSATFLNHVSNGRLITVTLPYLYDPHYGWFIYPLAPDPVHGVWRGDRQGLTYTDGESTRRIDFNADPCTVFWPNDLAIDAAGTIYLGTSQGQILKQRPAETNWTPVSLVGLSQDELKRPIVAITVSPDDILWASHGYDLFNVADAAGTHSVLPDTQCVLYRLVAATDSVWSWGNCGVWQFDIAQQTWRHHSLTQKQLSLLVVDSNGNIYAGGSSGLYRYVDSAWQQVADITVTAAAADKQGGLWLASRPEGKLWYYQAGQLTAFGEHFAPDGLWYLIVDKQNRLWAATTDALLRYSGGKWRPIYSPALDIDRIATDPAGRIWVTGRRSTSSLSDAAIAVYDPALEPQP